MLEHEKLHELESHCTQESAPRCRTACPLDMDVRTFVEKIAEGKPTESRKIIEKHLPLPSLLTRICDHPCEDSCLRRDLGGSLAISSLEKFCMASVSQQLRVFARPPKPQKLAVLGAGLAGMTVAFDISHKGFPVTVYHYGNPEDALLNAFPTLSKEEITAEFASLQKFHTTFISEELTEELLERLSKEHTAVFIDASCCAFFTQSREQIDSVTLHWRDNICCGGWLKTTPTGATYSSSSEQAGDGRKAGITLFRLMTGASLSLDRADADRQNRLHTPIDGIEIAESIEPQGEIYTAEEARQEASRCIRCSCMQCVKECPFLQKYKEFPRVYARKVYGNATIVKGTRTAGNVIMNGCALCGQCESICPDNFSMADMCLDARRDAVERDVMPYSAHEFAIEDMLQASGEESAFYIKDIRFEQSKAVFFPGCQLAGSRPSQVLAMYRYLREQFHDGIDLYSSCCGIPAYWAGREPLFNDHAAKLKEQWESHGKPQIITACSSCIQTLQKAIPEAQIVSLWSILDALMPEPFHTFAPKNLSVQDPCGARHSAEWQNAVRSLAKKAGISLEEPVHTGDKAACCGFGGLVWNAQQDVADAITEHRATEFNHPALTSCIMCHERFAGLSGSFHLFDILPQTAQEEGAPQKTTMSSRRAGRNQLKVTAFKEFLDRDIPPVQSDVIINISDEISSMIERRYILLQDIADTISGAEKTGAKFINRENNHFLASWRPRYVTFWAEYTKEEDGSYTLYNAWCHRMAVEGAIQPSEKAILQDRVHA